MNKDNVSRKVLALQWYKERINDMLASKDTSYKLQYLYDYPLWPFVQKWVNVARNSIYANEMIYQSVVSDALVELIGMNYDVIEDALLEYKYEILIHKFCREYRSVNEIKSNWSDVAYYLRWHCYSENILSVLSYDCKINESKDDVNVLEVFREFLSKWTKLFNDKVYNLVSNLLEEKKFTLPVFNKDNDLINDESLSVMFQIDTYNKCLEHLINPSVYKNHVEIIREIANKLGRVAGETKDTTIMESMLQYSYPSSPFEDIEGVTSGNRIMDMLPIEFSYFADKTTEILFYQRFATKQLQQFSSFPKEKNQNIQSTSVETKGPIIISIDTSSSMYGKPIDFAKWLVLKVFDIAVKENRPLYIIDFSVGCKSLDLSGENGREELQSFLKDCISGGSSGNEMMQEILLQLEKDTYKYADALIVSDFRFPALEPEIYNKVKASQKLGTKFYGVFVNDFPNINYKNVLDELWKVEL